MLLLLETEIVTFLNFSYLETGFKIHYATVVTVPISSILTMFMLLFQKSENLIKKPVCPL